VTDAVRERIAANNERGPADAEVRAYYERGRAAFGRQSNPHVIEAISILEEGLAKFPTDPWILSLLGRALLRHHMQRDSQDPKLAARAEEVSLRALAADPSLAETYHTIGLLRIVQGETRAGVRAFEEALLRSPRFVPAHTSLGAVLVETGRLAEGIQRLDLALRLDALAFDTWLERARAKALSNDRRGAEEDLRQASALSGALGTYWLATRLVVWWNDREGAARIADAMEQTRTGAAWEMAIPLFRALGRGEYFDGAPEIFGRVASTHASPRRLCTGVEIATEYFALFGRDAEAFRWLERAESLPLSAVTWLDRCPALASIRSDPRFAKVRALVAARVADLWR
jgi:serine/threonine-protein kinase